MGAHLGACSRDSGWDGGGGTSGVVVTRIGRVGLPGPCWLRARSSNEYTCPTHTVTLRLPDTVSFTCQRKMVRSISL
jgi:hypothetical protein